jgi:hypothetical protein
MARLAAISSLEQRSDLLEITTPLSEHDSLTTGGVSLKGTGVSPPGDNE